MIGSEAIPFQRLRIVPRHAAAVVLRASQFELDLSVVLLGQWTQSLQGSRAITCLVRGRRILQRPCGRRRDKTTKNLGPALTAVFMDDIVAECEPGAGLAKMQCQLEQLDDRSFPQ